MIGRTKIDPQNKKAILHGSHCVADAVGTVEDGFLVLRVDLRPADQRG